MKKQSACLMLALFCVSASVNAGSVRIYNSDSHNHTVKLKCQGSSKNLDIKKSSTSTYTFHSTASQCEIYGGSVDFPARKIKDGQAWKIRGGDTEKM